MNYYELLEVSPAASAEVIKNAYKTLAKKYHPDAYDGDKIFAEEKMKVLNEAISVLEDEEKRREYNMLNGIYQNTEIYDDGNGLNISVDENGEPAFFSYSEEFEDDDIISSKSSFMDTIDDFIANRKVKKNKPRKGRSIDLDDLAETLNSDGFDDENNMDIPDISEMTETDGENITGEYDVKDFRTVRLPGKNPGAKAPRWYYITVACLITGCVIMFFLVAGSLNFGNMLDIINRLSGGGSPAEEQTQEYTGAESYTEQEDITEEAIEFPDITPEPTTEFITESPTEPTMPPPTTTVRAAAPVTTAPPPPEQTIPPPPPPATEEPSAEYSTEEPAVTGDITEEMTEEPPDEQNPEEEPAAEEHTVPPESEHEDEPEEITEPELIGGLLEGEDEEWEH